jgi:hypothetical protein
MLMAFAKHHDLKHRLVLQPKSAPLSSHYLVTSVPQVVVIDRKGIVRKIVIGGNPKQMDSINDFLEELLADTQ